MKACRWCGVELQRGRVGRPRDFCSDAHRFAFHNLERRRAREPQPSFGETALTQCDVFDGLPLAESHGRTPPPRRPRARLRLRIVDVEFTT